jgi:hypothetical protein
MEGVLGEVVLSDGTGSGEKDVGAVVGLVVVGEDVVPEVEQPATAAVTASTSPARRTPALFINAMAPPCSRAK